MVYDVSVNCYNMFYRLPSPMSFDLTCLIPMMNTDYLRLHKGKDHCSLNKEKKRRVTPLNHSIITHIAQETNAKRTHRRNVRNVISRASQAGPAILFI
jgi:hypothetical protein